MADKEDTWSWWGGLKAAGAAVALGAGASMARGQYRANRLNEINSRRRLAQPGLRRIAAAEADLGRRLQVLPEVDRRVQSALSSTLAARRNVDNLGDYVAAEQARASAEAQKYVMDSMAPYYAEVDAMRRAGVKASDHGFLGQMKTDRHFVVTSAARQLGKARKQILAEADLPKAMHDEAKAEAALDLADAAASAARQEIAEMQRVLANPEEFLFHGGTTARHLRDYYAFRRAYRSEGLPASMPVWEYALEGPGANLREAASAPLKLKDGSASKVQRTRSDHGHVQGPFERVAKIAASYTIPGYNVGSARVRKGPDGKERPTRLDTAQNWVAGSKWPQRISKGALGVSLAGAGVWWLNHRNQLKKNEREVKAMGDQQRSELAQMLTNVVQVASAADPNEAYGQAGLSKVVAGVAAARGLGQEDAANGLLARVPGDALYMYGSQVFDRVSPDDRARLGFGGKGALDLSDEEMHEFARRHLGAMADQRLYQWTNSVPAAAGGDR